MADIGVLPTRTSVNITSTTGENGTIPAATTSAAGVMSAEQARQLDELYRSANGASAPIVIAQPAQRIDAVSRADLRHAMAELQRTIAANQPIQMLGPDLQDRMAALETHVDRLIEFEADMQSRIQALAQIVDGMCTLLDNVQTDQRFIERHAVAQIGVQQ